MSGGFPIQEYCSGQSAVFFSVNGPTPSATAHTKGSWFELIASTTYDTQLMNICVNQNGIGELAYDIGVGAAGSEKVIVNNLTLNTANQSPGWTSWGSILVPLSVLAGSRLSIRCQSDTASQTNANNVFIQLFDACFFSQSGFAGVDSLGFTTATTKGTAITAGATAATKGSYAEIIASTTRDYVGFFMSCPNPLQATYGYEKAFDIAMGAAGSEKIIIPDITFYLPMGLNDGSYAVVQWSDFYPVPVPAGQRLAARLLDIKASTSATEIVLYGVYQ